MTAPQPRPVRGAGGDGQPHVDLLADLRRTIPHDAGLAQIIGAPAATSPDRATQTRLLADLLAELATAIQPSAGPAAILQTEGEMAAVVDDLAATINTDHGLALILGNPNTTPAGSTGPDITNPSPTSTANDLATIYLSPADHRLHLRIGPAPHAARLALRNLDKIRTALGSIAIGPHPLDSILTEIPTQLHRQRARIATATAAMAHALLRRPPTTVRGELIFQARRISHDQVAGPRIEADQLAGEPFILGGDTDPSEPPRHFSTEPAHQAPDASGQAPKDVGETHETLDPLTRAAAENAENVRAELAEWTRPARVFDPAEMEALGQTDQDAHDFNERIRRARDLNERVRQARDRLEEQFRRFEAARTSRHDRRITEVGAPGQTGQDAHDVDELPVDVDDVTVRWPRQDRADAQVLHMKMAKLAITGKTQAVFDHFAVAQDAEAAATGSAPVPHQAAAMWVASLLDRTADELAALHDELLARPPATAGERLLRGCGHLTNELAQMINQVWAALSDFRGADLRAAGNVSVQDLDGIHWSDDTTGTEPTQWPTELITEVEDHSTRVDGLPGVWEIAFGTAVSPGRR
jgi:hypothetical protein